MNRTTTIKILWWIIALLVILDLTIIGTILVRNRAMGEEEIAIVLDEELPQSAHGKIFQATPWVR